MFGKLKLSLFTALIFSLVFAPAVLAQAPQPPAPGSGALAQPNGGRRGIGQITALSEADFTLTMTDGKQHLIRVDQGTRYHAQDWAPLGFEDLAVGDWVAGTTAYDAQGRLLAQHVIRLAPDYDPSQRLGGAGRGEVTAVDLQAGTFSIKNRRGQELTFVTGPHTVYRGELTGPSALQVGMTAAAAGIRQPDGALLAISVSGRYPARRFAGQVTEIDLAAGQLFLQTHQGEALTLAVDENTLFHSRDGAVQGLEEIAEGQTALGRAAVYPDGTLIARQLLIIP